MAFGNYNHTHSFTYWIWINAHTALSVIVKYHFLSCQDKFFFVDDYYSLVFYFFELTRFITIVEWIIYFNNIPLFTMVNKVIHQSLTKHSFSEWKRGLEMNNGRNMRISSPLGLECLRNWGEAGETLLLSQNLTFIWNNLQNTIYEHCLFRGEQIIRNNFTVLCVTTRCD